MPIFDNNGKKQNVQDAHVEKYMELYPDATTIMERDGKKYRVKAKDYNTFLGDTLRTAQETPKATDAPMVTAPQREVFQTQAEMAAPVRQPMPESEFLGKVGFKAPNGPVEGDIYKGEYGTFTRTEVPYKTKEYASIEDAKAGRELNIEVSDEEVRERMRMDAEKRAAERDALSLQRQKTGEQQDAVQTAMARAKEGLAPQYPYIVAEEVTDSLFKEFENRRGRNHAAESNEVVAQEKMRAMSWFNPETGKTEMKEDAFMRADDLGLIDVYTREAKKRILADKEMKARAQENADALGIKLEDYVDAVAVPALQERMWNEWIVPQEEEARKNYNALGAMWDNSIMGMLDSHFGVFRPKPETDTDRYMKMVGEEAWSKDASLLERAGVFAGAMALDLPFFGGAGKLASVPAKYAGRQALKQMVKNETKKMVARGVSEAAAKRYANYAVKNGLKNRIMLNLATAPLQSGLTFGMFDAGKAALNMSLNDEWNWGELGKSAAGGTLLGGALGLTGAVGSGLTHGLTGAAKYAGKVAEFGVENAVFTEGGRLIGKLHGEQPENGWLEDYVESGATLLMIKAPNIVKNIASIKGNKEASEVFAFNKLEREQLAKYGKDLNAVLESLLPQSAKLYEDGFKINEGTFTEEYRRVMLDPDIAMTTKAKLMGIVEGKAMTTPRVTDAVLEGNRVMTYDPMGRLVEVKEYATEAKANAEYKKVADRAEVESIGVLEDVYMRIKGYEADELTVREWLAKNPKVTMERVAEIVAKNSAGEKLTEAEQKILESLRQARREGLNDVRHLNDVLAGLDVDAKDVMSGLDKPIDKRTERENRAVRAYTDVLFREVKDKIQEPYRRGEAQRAADDVWRAANNVRWANEDVKLLADRIYESDRQIDETANDGMVYTTTAPSGEKIIITGGKVVLDNEGYIDVNQSEGLVALMPDGTKKPVRPGDLREKVEVSNAEEMKAVKREEIEQEIAAEPIAESGEVAKNEVLTYEEGGETHSIEVLGDNGDGTSRIISDGQEKIIGNDLLESLRAQGVEAQKGENAEKVVESSPTGEAAAPVVEAPKTALEQIPRNEKNVPLYEQVDSELAWDGVVEEAGGNEETAMVAVNSMIADKQDALKKAEKAKARAGVTITEKIAAENECVANIEKAKADLAKWEEIAGVKAKRAAAQAENVAVPVVEETQAPVVESAPVVENSKVKGENGKVVETPQATNEMQEANLENAEKGQKAVETVEENKPKVRGRKQVEKAVERMRKADAEGNAFEAMNQAFTAEVNAKRGDEGAITPEEQAEIDALKKKYAEQGYEVVDLTGMEYDGQIGNLAESEQAKIGQKHILGDLGFQVHNEGDKLVVKSVVKPAIIKDGVIVQKAKVLIGPEGTSYSVFSGIEGEVKPTAAEEVADAQAFAEASAQNTVEAYLNYLDKFPEGAYREGARAGAWMIEGINPETHGRNVDARNAANAVLARVPSSVEESQEVAEPVGKTDSSTLSQTSDQVSEKYVDPNELSESFIPRPMESNDPNDIEPPIVVAKNKDGKIRNYYVDMDMEVGEHNINGNETYPPLEVLYEEYGEEFLKKHNIDPAVLPTPGSYRLLGYNNLGFYIDFNGGEYFILGFGAPEHVTQMIKQGDYRGLMADAPKVESAQKAEAPGQSGVEKIQKPTFVEEVLENGDKRITNYNSRGEVATVATERDGKVVSVDSYDEGVLFEHTEYDTNGVSTSVTRYDKQGNAIGTQVYVDGKAVPSETAEQPETGEVADAGPVNRETLQLNMSEEDFNALLNSGDKAAISEYLAEMDGLLRIGAGSPLDGRDTIVKEYRGVVEQYGGEENIPADVVAGFDERIAPYNALQRAVFDRKYALQDKLREIEASEAQAKEQAEKEAKAEHKKTAFGGFLAGKTDLGASAAEKALNKKYNFDGKVMTVAEFVEEAVANGNAKLLTIEEPKYKGASRAAWNRMDARQQEADAKRVKESGTKTVYTVNDHDFGKTAYDYAKFLLDKKAEQEKAAAKQKVKDAIEPFAKEKAAEQAPIKIEDVGEKIGGAKKDRFAEGMARIKAELEETDETLTDKLAKLPVSQVFNFDLEKLREGGISNEAISFIKIVKDYLPAKPRKTYKIRSWVNNTLALYKLCLEAGTNWDRVNTLLNGPQFTSSSLKEQFDAYMAIGGFDSGMNIGNAALRQLDNKSGRYDESGKFVTLAGKWYVRDAGKHGGIYDTKEEAVNALKAFAGDKAGVTSSGKKKEVKFAVYQRRQDKSIFIAVKGKSDIVIQDGFKSSKEAFDYIEANNAELQERYRALLDKTNADFEDNRPREGRDYRDGKDIPAEEFRTTFGFRGVEFGNWMTQEDRRKALNECYDALMDLAAVCKVSPQALSLGGTLGMAFGARGGGRFSAHYEPGKLVINLTKTKGAGSLAHEWFHALDNYFAKMGSEGLDVYATAGEGLFPEGVSSIGKRYYDRKSGQMLTEEEYNERMNSHEVRREMADAWKSLMETLKKSDYYKRSLAYAGLHNSNYWSRPTELGARAFSTWVENELSKQGASNDYLANNPRFLVSEATNEQSRFMPYPFDADATWMEEAFGNLFEVMQEKTTEDGKAVLYSIAEDAMLKDKGTEAFERATKVTMDAVERLKANGVKVNETTENEFRDKYEAETEIIHDDKTKVSEIAANVEKQIEELRSIEEEQTLISNTDNPTSSLTQETEQPSPQTSGGNVVAPYEAKINKKLRSSRDLARKMLSFLDKIKEGEVKAENFPADLVENLGVSKQVEGSEYVHFVSQDGEKITLRLSDHHGNARNIIIKGVRTDKGVSIVISLPGVDLGKYKANKWAKVDEYVYESPSVEQLYNIGKSIFNLFNSGEYIDLADAKEHLRSPRVTELKANGVVYGWAMNGEIYLTPDGINPNTPVHEYAHLWGADVEKNNPKLWNEVVEAMKLSPVWDEVANDANYSNIHGNDSRMASEVLSRLSGRENYRRTMEEAEKEIAAERDIVGKVQKKGILNRIKNALKNFWDWVQRNVFRSGKRKDESGQRSSEVMPWEEFANSVVGDFYKGKNPDVKESSLERMFMGKKGADNLDKAEEATTRLDNLNVAREMETAGKDAKAIKLATGWERGADRKWRYETEDEFKFDRGANIEWAKRNPERYKEYRRYRELLHKANYLGFDGLELPAEEKAEFEHLSVMWDGTQLHNSRTLKDYIDAPDLFEAYPELRDVKVKFETFEDGTLGKYNPKANTITLNEWMDEKSLKSTLNHEIQHAIQHIEGFARGGNISTVAPRVQTFREDVYPLHNMMLDTPEWAEKQRLLSRWLAEEDKAEPDRAYQMQLQERIDEIDSSGVLKGIENKQAELIKKYGYDKNVINIINEPYSEDAEIWDNLPGDFYDRYESYRRLAGEVESRNVEERMGMSPEERRNKLAEETEDVRREDQIFLEKNLGESASEAAEEDIPVEEVQTQPLTFAEKITNSVLEASAKNKENLALRSDALRMFGRDVANVLKLMGKQREYDKSTVDQLVKLAKMYFKDAQLLGGLTPYQVGRVMTRLNNAVGKRDITDDANELVNILVDAHNKELEKMLEKQAKTKAKKVNASGVEVIGKLDKEGQLLLEEFNAGKELDLESIDDKIIDLQNEAAEGKAEEAAARIRGLVLARQYRENILSKLTEIKGLEQELKTAEKDAKDGAMDRAAYKEFRRATERAILESKLEMVDAYHGLIHGLGGDISSSAKRAKLFQQQQIDHVKEIQHNANSDLLGHPAEAQGETPDKWNSSVPRFFMSAMPTFQTMLKFFGEKAADGRGYLYERFIPQHTQASHNEYVGKTEAREKMRKKLTEIFGKKTTIENFMDMSRKEGAVLEYQEGGQKKTIDLTRGQVLYLYMINKMADGQMKLSRMGITDADVLKMAKELPEEMVRFADWVQEEFLTELREKYNKVHERMFGAPMAAIESYFPIKINKRSRGEKIEPGMNAEDKPSTITGSVIKRTKNAVAIDLSADAMQVLLGHIDDMENWAAWAEFRRDVKSLLNYRHFQNQVKGMESLRYGSGEKLWKNFVDVANIAAGSFKPSSTAADRAVRNIAKGVVSSKITFRYFTAVKQILSTPAFWSEVDFGKMMNAYLHQKEAWDWAMKNLPGFSKRWEGRASGNEILLESDADWKVWQNRAVQWLSKEGMRANAFIDALTVATGAKAVFETKYEMFKKAGYSEDRAREKALNRAAEAYNESQQSSESAYLSPLQAEATFVSSVLTAYRNSPFGYNRKFATAIANLKKKMKKGFKQESIDFMIKQLMRDGLNEEQAKKFAKSTYRRSVARDAADVALYEFFLNYVWVLGPSLINILGGDYDEIKKVLNVEALIDGAMGGLGNLPAGETLTGAIKAIAEGDVSQFQLPQAVAMQDMETIADLMQTDPVRAAGEVLNILVAMGVGVNPQTFTDMFVALADTEDFSPREIAMLVLRLINAPNSKLELLEADEAMENYGANIEEITREYAEYQKSKRAPLTGWMYSDESEQKAIERYEKRYKKILDERFESIVENTDEYDMWYENSDPQMKAKLAKLRQKFLEGDKETTMEKLDSIDVTKKVLFGSGYDEVNTVYYELSTAEDEDMAMMIDTKLKELQPMMDEYKKLRGDERKTYREENLEQIQFYNKLNAHKNNVNNLKGAMKKKPEEAQEKMEKIRKIRTKAIGLINNYNE